MYKRNNFVCTSIPELSFDYSYDEIQHMLHTFICKKNNEIERFLKESAIEFVKKCQAITYVIFDVTNNDVVTYFTLAVKPICLAINTLSMEWHSE